jgi:hypothetical protein
MKGRAFLRETEGSVVSLAETMVGDMLSLLINRGQLEISRHQYSDRRKIRTPIKGCQIVVRHAYCCGS